MKARRSTTPAAKRRTAIALALASPEIAPDLLDKRVPFLRDQTERGAIAVELATGRYEVTLRRGAEKEIVESNVDPMHRPWVIGYGVRRGDPIGEPERPRLTKSFGALHTLFGHVPAPHAASRWLADLDAEVDRERRRFKKSPGGPLRGRASIWHAVETALHRLLGITRIEVDAGGNVHVEHPQFKRVRLDALSDGYLVTASWVIDMMARWIEHREALDKPVGDDILAQMTGLALIDEIDQHLHPRWQLSIVHNIRELFPRMSFIVTTHNPLTLQGALPSEVYVVRWNGPDNARYIELAHKDIKFANDVDYLS